MFLDCDFLLGPRGAHLNISVSGLATKTSAVEFLLSSIFQRFPAHKGSIGAICFNVKLISCFLISRPTFPRGDHALYARMGLAPSRSATCAISRLSGRTAST